MQRTLQGLTSLGLLTAITIASSSAFFSDSEISNGNTFTTGEVELQIGYQSYYNKPVDGQPNSQSWDLTDLTSEKFFNFANVSPGDYGSGNITLKVSSIDTWACMNITNVTNDENTCTNSEIEAEHAINAQCVEGGIGGGWGDLGFNLFFTFWLDNGDGIWQTGEELLLENQQISGYQLLDGLTIPIADASTGFGPLVAGSDYNIGIKWCVGEMEINQSTGEISCDGSSVTNASQTDSFTADLSFYVEQSSNNEGFLCNADFSDQLEFEVASNVTPFFQSESIFIPPGYNSITFKVDPKVGYAVWAPVLATEVPGEFYEQTRQVCGVGCEDITVPIIGGEYRINLGASDGGVNFTMILKKEPGAEVVIFGSKISLPFVSSDFGVFGKSSITPTLGEWYTDPSIGTHISSIEVQKKSGESYLIVSTLDCDDHSGCPIQNLSLSGDGLYRLVANGNGTASIFGALLRP